MSRPPLPTASRFLDELRRRLPLTLALALAVVVGLSLYADLSSLLATIRRFNWVLLPGVVLLTLVNYFLRFVKWHYYLRVIGVGSIRWGDSLLIFLSGLAMVITPAKVGEWLKSYLLREARGVPFSRSAPIVVAERLTDGLAMLLLASAGLLAYGYGRELLLVVLLGAAALIAVVQYRPLALRLLGLGERAPLISSRMHQLHQFYESAYQLLRARPLGLAISLGLISWGAECVAFYLILVGLGVPAGDEMLLKATFVLAASTLVGAVSMIPGGLAVAEGSIAGMLTLLGVTTDTAVAAVATLLIRLGTLWLGVSVGVVALALVGRRVARKAAERSNEDPSPGTGTADSASAAHLHGGGGAIPSPGGRGGGGRLGEKSH